MLRQSKHGKYTKEDDLSQSLTPITKRFISAENEASELRKGKVGVFSERGKLDVEVDVDVSFPLSFLSVLAFRIGGSSIF